MDAGLRYRKMLRDEFETRVRKNPQYSLRAFSRYLEMEPAQLSRVLNGKQNISTTRAVRVADLLFQSEAQQKLFTSLVDLATARKARERRRSLERVLALQAGGKRPSLELETLKSIAEWYHIAILDLSLIDGMVLTPRRIAGELGISLSQAKLALDRLQTLGLLTPTAGRLRKSSQQMSTPTNIPSEALRAFHRQMMAKAADSLESQPIENRYIVGKTFAVGKAELPQLRELIEEFRAKVSELLARSRERKTSVYQLNVQLFELTRTWERKTK